MQFNDFKGISKKLLFILFFPLFFINVFFLENFFSPDKKLNFNTKFIIWIFDLLYFFCIFFIIKRKKLIFSISNSFKNFFFKKSFVYTSAKFAIYTLFIVQIFFIIRNFWIISPPLNIVYGFDTDGQLPINFIISGYSYYLPYGPLHSYLISLFKSFFLLSLYDVEIELLERLLYFIQLLINLFSIILISYLFSRLLFNRNVNENSTNIKKNFFFFYVFNFIILNQYWLEYLFKARVELFYCAMVTTFAFFFTQYHQNKNNLYSVFCGSLCSICLLAKTSFVIFLPLILIYQIIIKDRIRNFFFFYSSCAFFYLVGWIGGHIYLKDLLEFIIWINYFSTGFTLESIYFRISNFFDQSYIIFIALTFFYFVFYRYSFKKNFYNDCVIFLIPFGAMFLISKNYEYPTAHYTLSIICMFFCFLLNFVSSNSIELKMSQYVKKFSIFIFTFIMALIYFFNYFQVDQITKKYSLRNNDLKKFYNKISKYENVMVDAYVPFDKQNSNFFQCPHLGCQFQMLIDKDIKFIILNTVDSKRVLDEKNSYHLSSPGRLPINEAKQFYKIFLSKKKIILDKNEILWKKKYLDNKFVIWEKN